MAFNGYDIDTEASRTVVKNARDRFDDMNGMEHSLQGANAKVSDAAQEEDITAALETCYSQFLRPFTVTMIETGKNIFDATDSLINAYDNGDSEMSDRAKSEAVEDMGGAIGQYEDIPNYSETDTTGAKEDAPRASTIEAEKGK